MFRFIIICRLCFFICISVRFCFNIIIILYGNRVFLVLISIFALILVYYFMLKNKSLNKMDISIYSLLIGGILGNLFDRVIYGYVVDYLDFCIFGYNFPIFNLADVCIVISVGLIIIDSIWGDSCAVKGR